MAKRLTDTEKWRDAWFRKLSPVHKCFWNYLCDNCDSAGVWKVDMELAGYCVGAEINEIDVLSVLGERILPLKDGYWLIKGFVPFQYGLLSTASGPHISVLRLIEKHTLVLGYPKGTARAQRKVKVKEEVRDFREKRSGEKGTPDSKIREWFGKIWLSYPKERRHGKDVAYRRFEKTVKDIEGAKRCVRALENYLNSEQVKKGFVLRASKWFEEWEDHANDDGRNSQSLYDTPPERRTEVGASGQGVEADQSGHVLQRIANSKTF